MNNPFLKPIFKISNNFQVTEKSCNGPNNYFEQCLNKDQNVINGSERPIQEKCPVITGQTEIPCNSLWNNMTKRKSLVKDY